MRFPDALVANVLGYDGERGESWLQDLPRLVAAGCRRWRLEAPRPLAELSFNYLVAGRCRDGRAVAKFMVERSALVCETAWLRAQQGRGAVRLLDVAEDIGAYLMAEVAPARRVGVLDERAATETIATQIANLSGLAALDSLPSINTWFAELPALAQQRLAGIDQAAIHRSAAIASALMVAPCDERLLHGDLHHDNVLSANDGWCVIDPKGVTGDPAHECAAMLQQRPRRLTLERFADDATRARADSRRLDRPRPRPHRRLGLRPNRAVLLLVRSSWIESRHRARLGGGPRAVAFDSVAGSMLSSRAGARLMLGCRTQWAAMSCVGANRGINPLCSSIRSG